MLSLCFSNICLGYTDLSSLAVTNSLIDVRGKWAPNSDDKMLVSRFGMAFDRDEDPLEFYKDTRLMLTLVFIIVLI